MASTVNYFASISCTTNT